jgi:branched-chain amino acid transport system ATP-binding protein
LAEILSSPLLSLESINVHYGAIQALYDIDISVKKGEVVSVLGGNASGKSTTVKTVLGLIKPSSGSVTLKGERIDGKRTAEVIARSVASIPEGRRVFPEMTVYDNLLLGAYSRRHDRSGIQTDLDVIYQRLPRLYERRSQLAGSLSGGEQQLLALARAWMRRADLICIDEPSMGLSPKLVDDVYEILFEWKAAGNTILLVEQNARMALELADRAYVLQHGHVVLQGLSTDLAADDTVQRAYLGAL